LGLLCMAQIRLRHRGYAAFQNTGDKSCRVIPSLQSTVTPGEGLYRHQYDSTSFERKYRPQSGYLGTVSRPDDVQ
jgi:hypothetical protein